MLDRNNGEEPRIYQTRSQRIDHLSYALSGTFSDGKVRGSLSFLSQELHKNQAVLAEELTALSNTVSLLSTLRLCVA